ncbi:MAG: Asp23/Gls24 family envelope stress response protein [Lachnospiraceae bacterium]|nr:Asp23/Gls24 family envelope stress response protein [Lachnospiraceae bacterium]
MADEKGFTIKENVTITEEVLSIIAGLAATEVDGVSSLNGGLTGDDITKAGVGRIAKAIKVSVDEAKNIIIKLSVCLDYGYEIPTVCEQVQEKVKTAVENMTGLNVSGVDLKIAEISA